MFLETYFSIQISWNRETLWTRSRDCKDMTKVRFFFHIFNILYFLFSFTTLFFLLFPWGIKVTGKRFLISPKGCLFNANVIAKGVTEFVSYPPDIAAWYHHWFQTPNTSVLPHGEQAACTVTILSIVKLLHRLKDWDPEINTVKMYTQNKFYCDTFTIWCMLIDNNDKINISTLFSGL